MGSAKVRDVLVRKQDMLVRAWGILVRAWMYYLLFQGGDILVRVQAYTS